jgi:hypothetical protein
MTGQIACFENVLLMELKVIHIFWLIMYIVNQRVVSVINKC